MTILLFVHGTGVRDAQYNNTFATIQRQVARHLGSSVDVEPCNWGPLHGAKLNDQGASVPTYDAARVDPNGGEIDVRQREAVRWQLLRDDPLYELRSLAGMTATAGNEDDEADVGPEANAPLTPHRLEGMLSKVRFTQDTASDLVAAGFSDLHATALDVAARLAEDPIMASALRSPAMLRRADRNPPLARAFVAMWLNVGEEAELPPIDGRLRERMFEDVISSVFGGAAMGFLDRLWSLLAPLATRGVTYVGKRKRSVITDAAYPAAADILVYQARGQALRDFIATRIRQAAQTGRPVYVLAHSLGGIASVEVLAAADAPEVAGLITVGSQAPLLYELNALQTLPHTSGSARLRERFPPWLNLYDLNDLLSYVGAGVFPGRVTDVECASRQPFPESHSAYWTQARVWAEIKRFVTQP